jgi:hypothetical protein
MIVRKGTNSYKFGSHVTSKPPEFPTELTTLETKRDEGGA